MAGFTASIVAVLRTTFAREVLPPPPPPPPAAARRRGLVSLLFAPEPLPPDLPPTPRGGRHWLAWLFSPDRLEP